MQNHDLRINVTVILNHVIWSMYPLCSRYLQVKAEPRTMDLFVLLSSAKFTALSILMVKRLLESKVRFCIDNSKQCTSSDSDKFEQSDQVEIITLDENVSEVPEVESIPKRKSFANNNDVSETSCAGSNDDKIATEGGEDEAKSSSSSSSSESIKKFRRRQWITRILYGSLATGRASFAVLAARYTKAYRLVLINLLVPLLTAIADRIFLSKKLPVLIWPTIVLSLAGAFLATFELGDEQVGDGHENGIIFQCISVIFQVLCRLLMKLSQDVVPKWEVNISGSVCTFLLALLVTFFQDFNHEWSVFGTLSLYSWLIWGFVTVFVYVIAYTSTVSLIRELGPALYSAVGGIRIIFTLLIGKVTLNEGIDDGIEWFGVSLVLVSISYFLWKLHRDQAKNKERQTTDEFDIESKSGRQAQSVNDEVTTPLSSLNQIIGLMMDVGDQPINDMFQDKITMLSTIPEASVDSDSRESEETRIIDNSIKRDLG